MKSANVVDPGRITEELQRYVSQEVLRGRREVEVDLPLIESGVLDSLGLLQIVAHVEKQYGADLTQAGEPNDFRSIATLARAVSRLRPSR